MTRLLFVYLALMIGFGVVYIVWPQNRVLAIYGSTAGNLALLMATSAFTRAALLVRSKGWVRFFLIGLTAGLWCWVVAGLLEIIALYDRQSSYGSVSDFLWVTGYIPMFAGLFPGFRDTWKMGRRTALFIFVVVFAGYCAVFYLYLFPHLADAFRPLPEKVLDVVYGSFNFVLLGMILAIYRSLSLANNPHAVPFQQLALATGIMIVSDLLLSYYTDPESVMYQVLDLPYFALYFLIFLAGLECIRIGRNQPALLS